MIVHNADRLATAPAVEIATGTSFTVLVALARVSALPREELDAELREALDRVGDTAGETWLNLLGVPLDAGPPYSAERLLLELDTIDPVELRRHLLGRYAWSWCTLGGVDVIEAAAAGDRPAAASLLAHPRYYAAHAADSLAVLLPLEPEETRRRLRRAAEVGLRQLVGEHAPEALEAAARAATAVLADPPPLEAIERITPGYRYVPELEAERVLLIPHLEPRLPLVLAQHRSTRLIAYAARADLDAEERLVVVGRALSDTKRVEILALVGRGVSRPGDLVEQTGLSRSTVHHHLTQLREAGLVALEGNARAYAYVPRRDILPETSALLSEILGSAS